MKTRILLVTLAVAGCGGPSTSPPSSTYDATFTVGPFRVPAGADQTFCTFVRADNAVAQDLALLHTEHNQISHHLIVYAVDHAVDLAPRPCAQGGQPGWQQLMVSQTESDDLDFPAGIGLHVRAHQQYVIETHFINATTAAVDGTGTFSVRYAAPAATLKRAAPVFFGSTNIDIAPGGTLTSQTTCTLPQGMSILRLFGHEHRFGTGVEAQLTRQGGAPSSIYRTDNWDSPPTTVFSPALDLATGDSVSVRCDWTNSGDRQLYYPREMCYAIGVYYPAQGTMFCASSGGASACQCFTFGATDVGSGGSTVKVELSRADPIAGTLKGDAAAGRPIYCSLWDDSHWSGLGPKGDVPPLYFTDVEDAALKDASAKAELVFDDVTPGDYHVFCWMDTIAGGFNPGTGTPIASSPPVVTARLGETATVPVTLDFAIP